MSFSRENSIISSSASYGQPIYRGPVVIQHPNALTIRRSTSSEHPQRTLEDVRDEVAQSIVVSALRKAILVDGTKIGVIHTLASSSSLRLLHLIATKLHHALLTSHHLFALAPATSPTAAPLILCASSDTLVHRAALLVSSKFLGRLAGPGTYAAATPRWLAHIHDLGTSAHDAPALWDAVRKAARAPMDPLAPPPGSRSADTLLAQARARLQRISPREACDELRAADAPWPVVLVDIRTEAQRAAGGRVRGALVVERNVLEWRFDPRSRGRLQIADRYDLRVIVICQEGVASSMAAATLHDLGLLNATDVIGGIEAWKAAGLPMDDDHPVSVSQDVTPSEEY